MYNDVMFVLRHAKPTIKRVVWVSFLVDLSDIVLNLFVAIVSGSVVMLTEVLQGAADLAASGLLLLGVHRSSKRANKDFQFGYGRDLFLWVLVSAICMFVLAGGLSFVLGFHRYLNPQAINHINLAYVVLAIGLVTNLYALNLSFRRLFANRKQKRLAQLLNSSMVETKTTLFLDAIGSVAAVFGFVSLVLLKVLGNDRFDGIGAMLIGVAVASLALFIIRDVRSLLIGRAASDEEEQVIRNAAMGIKGVKSIRDLRTMYLGSAKLLVNLEVNLDPELHTLQIEKIMDDIKADIKHKVPNVAHIQVELESLAE